MNPPTEPGFYVYDGGAQTLVFLLVADQWWTVVDSGSVHACDWDYIEQALGTWNLVRLDQAMDSR